LIIGTRSAARRDSGQLSLAEVLKEKWIGGAGLDGLSIEPARQGNRLLKPDIPNLVLTPHAAWASEQATAAFSEQLIANIEAFVQGRQQQRVACNSAKQFASAITARLTMIGYMLHASRMK